MPKVCIGTSGYNYDHWSDGVFYPEGLPQKKWLEYYCRFFGTVELNVTFYRLLKEEAFSGWYKRTPPGFRFALKGSRFITHIKRLKDTDEPLRLFLSRIKPLKEKADIILWQLPPRFKMDKKRLAKFFSSLGQISKSEIRHTFEFRDESWICRDVSDILSENNISFCMADWPPFNNDLPITADFVYVRRHGASGSYSTSYSKKELQNDARRIKAWLKKKRDVYFYFNNDACGYAVTNAITLKDLMG
jgi:uncharacterized protein YecE (DUF72 family)